MTASDTARIGELLDEAIEAVNRGDLTTAHNLAELVLIQDSNDNARVTCSQPKHPRTASYVGSRSFAATSSVRPSCRSVRNRAVPHARPALPDAVPRDHSGSLRRAHCEREGRRTARLVRLPDRTRGRHPACSRRGLEICRAIRQLSEQAQRQFGEALDVHGRAPLWPGVCRHRRGRRLRAGREPRIARRRSGRSGIRRDYRRSAQHRRQLLQHREPKAPRQSVKGFSEALRPFTVVAQRAEPPDHRSRRRSSVDRGEFDRRALLGLRPAPAPRHDRLGADPRSTRYRQVTFGSPLYKDHVRVDGGSVVHLDASLFHAGAGFHPVQVLLEARCRHRHRHGWR